MRQVGLIPSGAQQWFHRLCHGNSKFFLYCSTLAIYVHRTDDYSLDKVLTGFDTTFTHCVLSPHPGSQLVVTSSYDFVIRVWDLSSGDCVKSMNFPHKKSIGCIVWHPQDEDTVAVGLENGSLFLLNLQTAQSIEYNVGKSSFITCCSFNRGNPDLVLCGYKDGTTILYSLKSKKKMCRYKPPEKAGEVRALEWDPLSDQFFLIGYSSGIICLCDSEREEFLNRLQDVGCDLGGLQWIQQQPGDFLSYGRNSGVVRQWNVSKSSSTSSLSIRDAQLSDFEFLCGTELVVCSFQDGSVGVFNYKHKKMDFMTQPSHTETIFNCAFSAVEPNLLATSSYDRTVRLWDMSKMECVDTLQGSTSTIYSVSWSPDSLLVAGCTAKGEIFIWDAESTQVKLSVAMHSDLVYNVSWNSIERDTLASASADGACVVFRENGEVLKRYSHPKAVFGVDWSILKRSWLATGCFDGVVRVFDVTSSGKNAFVQLRGHTEAVYNVCWSPLVFGMLASGSNDRSIRVWHLSEHGTEQSVTVLRGHEHNVRALSWSHEIPFHLYSGGWDGSFRIWDVRDGSAIHVLRFHYADVYAITSHPLKPFTFVSSSRDTTLRVWDLAEEVAAVRHAAIMDKSWEEHIIGNTEDVMKPGAPLRLCGAGSRSVMDSLRSAPDTLERQRLVFQFFMHSEGPAELFDLACRVLNHLPSNPFNLVIHGEDLLRSVSAKARGLATARSKIRSTSLGAKSVLGSYRLRPVLNSPSAAASSSSRSLSGSVAAGSSSRSVGASSSSSVAQSPHLRNSAGALVTLRTHAERVQKAALLFAQAGDLRDACEAHIERGDWKAALSLAPGVSLEYWQQLCLRQGEALLEQGDEMFAQVLLAAGEVPKVVECYVQRNQLDDATLVAQAWKEGKFPTTGVSGADASTRRVDLVAGSSAKSVTTEVARSRAHALEHKYQPIWAACAYLANSDPHNAIRVLCKNGQDELAYSLCLIFDMCRDFEEVLYNIALRCEQCGQWSFAKEVTEVLRNPLHLRELICARLSTGVQDIDRVHAKLGIRSIEAYRSSQVVHTHASGEDVGAQVKHMVLARLYEDAIRTGLERLRVLFAQDAWDFKQLRSIVCWLSCIPHTEMTLESCEELMAYAFIVGGMDAMWRGFDDIAPYLFELALSKMEWFRKHAFPKVEFVRLMHAMALGTLSRRKGIRKLEWVLDFATNPPDVTEAATKQLATLKEHEACHAPTSTHEHCVRVLGGALPCRGFGGRMLRSAVSGKEIKGPSVNLSSGRDLMSLSEARMWSKVCRFSPAADGSLMPEIL